jgi:hypothetical protein
MTIGSLLIAFAIVVFNPSRTSLNDAGAITWQHDLRAKILSFSIRNGMSREAVLNLMGTPDMQVVCKGGRTDIFISLGVTIEYDSNQMVQSARPTKGMSER